MKKILVVFGTRPEAIKMSPLVKEFQKFPEQFNIRVCVTAQHREMLDQVLNLFEISPEYDLNIMQIGQDLYDVTSRVLLGMRDVLKMEKPDIVLVHGDTSTSTATALAAFYQQIPVGHVEAGLRTHNIYSPWPEEMNRQVTSRLTTYHFSPTLLNKENLLNEGIKEESIYITGNTVIDALKLALLKIESDSLLKKNIIGNLKKYIPNYIEYSNSNRILLVTGHRRENFGQGFINICNALNEIAIQNPDCIVVYPVHLNPNVKDVVTKLLNDVKNIYLIPPLEYLPFVYLMNRAYLILTDSGGIQEEAPGIHKPVLVMRETTERVEAVAAGTVKLVGTNKEMIIKEVNLLLSNKTEYEKMANSINPFGEGDSCSKIVKFLKKIE